MCLCIQVFMYYMRTLPLDEVNVAFYKLLIPCMLCGCTCAYFAYTSHLVLSQFMCALYFLCLQCERSKRKSFWNDREETVLQEYPIGTGSNSKIEAPSFSCTQGKRQVSHPTSTLLMPHLSTCEQSPSLCQTRPIQTPLYTSNISPSCAIPQPPLIQPSHVSGSMSTQQPRYSVTTAAASLIDIVFV